MEQLKERSHENRYETCMLRRNLATIQQCLAVVFIKVFTAQMCKQNFFGRNKNRHKHDVDTIAQIICLAIFEFILKSLTFYCRLWKSVGNRSLSC